LIVALPTKSTSNATVKYLSLLLFCIVGFSCAESTTPSSAQPQSATERIDYDARLEELGITLSEPSSPVANYVNAVQAGNLMFLAGKGPSKPDGGYITGKVGTELTIEEGYEAARLTAIAQLSVMKAELGDLNRVKRIVKVVGMVNADPSFTMHPEVINGFSDLMVEVFGERGKHARAAIGMGSLPRDIAVEIDVVIEVE